MKTATINIVSTPAVLLDRDQACAYMGGISPALLHRLVAQGKLPKPRQISGNRVGWLRTELEAAALQLPVSKVMPGPGRRAATEDAQA